MFRLFSHGDIEEKRLVKDLTSIGLKVLSHDPKTGRQFSFKLFGGHFGGSLDGVALGLVEAPNAWHLLEFKTHNDKSFKLLEKKGVREAKPEHFAQMQSYMGMSKEYLNAPLSRALYLATNKNTDDIYEERIKYEEDEYLKIKTKAKRIIFSNYPLAKISEKPDFYKCKWCNFSEVCHPQQDNIKIPEKNCRTCCFSSPKEDGTWYCEEHQQSLSFKKQVAGCDQHLFLPDLIGYEQVDVTEEGIIYKDSSGNRIVNKRGGLFE